MSVSPSKLQLMPTTPQKGPLALAKSYNSKNDDLFLLGNTIITPVKRNRSPASLGAPSSLELSPPQNIRAPNLYAARPSLDYSLEPNNNFGGPGSRGFLPAIDTGVRSAQDLLSPQSYNNFGSRPTLNRTPSRNSPIMLVHRDYVPDTLDPYNMQPGYMPQDHVVDDVGPVVSGYLDKQNQLVAKILRDVQEYKHMEMMREKMMYDQQFNMPMNMPMNIPMSPYMNTPMNMPMNGMMPPYQPVPFQYNQPYNQAYYQDPFDQRPSRGMMPTPTRMPRRASPQFNINTNPAESPNGKGKRDKKSKSPSSQEKVTSPPKKKGEKGETEEKSASPSKKKGETLIQAGRELKKKPVKKANKARGRRNLKSVLWTMALPGLWFISVVQWGEERKEKQIQALEEAAPEHLEKFLEFASQVLDKEIKALVMDKNSMVIVQQAGVHVNSAELDKRCKLITEHLVAIVDALSMTLDEGKLPKEYYKFLATMSEDDSVYPENFLSGFEMEKLSFGMFGNLKSMNEWKSKMILGIFLLVKGLLYFLIMRSWSVIPSIPEKNVNMKNMINVGSIFYHIILDIFNENIEEKQEDEEEAQPPFKPKPPVFAALEPGIMNKLDVIPDDNDDDELEVISGFYNRDRLISYLDDRPSITKEVKESVIDFLDVVYEKSHAAYQPKAHVKKMFAGHRPPKH